MSPLVLVRYLFGDARAIRALAETSCAFPAGVALVMLTAVARNYDQTFIGESALWLFGNLLFSFFSGSFLFYVLYGLFIRGHLPPDQPRRGWRQWWSFMGLFWMTAPIAWLYAIPVERFFNSYRAAQTNISLLAVVSLWRVLLMSRVVSVITGVSLRRSLGWVTFAASAEVIIVVAFGSNFSSRLLASMTGMRNSPEEELLRGTLYTAWLWSWILFLSLTLLILKMRNHGPVQPFPETPRRWKPWLTLAALALVWTLIAWPAQLQQQRFVLHAKLIKWGRYEKALAFLANHRHDDFPRSRRIEPNPYEFRVWDQLPPTVAALTPDTPDWIRTLYLDYLSISLTHRLSFYRSAAAVTPMILALESLPEGREWILDNQDLLARKALTGVMNSRNDGSSEDTAARSNLLRALERIGMSNGNLLRLKGEQEEE